MITEREFALLENEIQLQRVKSESANGPASASTWETTPKRGAMGGFRDKNINLKLIIGWTSALRKVLGLKYGTRVEWREEVVSHLATPLIGSDRLEPVRPASVYSHLGH